MLKRIFECLLICSLLAPAVDAAFASDQTPLMTRFATVSTKETKKKAKAKSEAAKADSDAKSVASKPAPKPQPAPECRICRWFELQQATISTRYRAVETSGGVTTNNQVQHNEAFKARFKFDRAGKYSVNAGVFSGNNFTGSWNNTGIGTGAPFTNLYLKQLYFSAKPVNGVEFQYGGLYLQRGENTEITSYDNDAYVTGERVSVKQPKKYFFDEVSVTYAYLGDLTKPHVTKRFHRLNESNYHQFFVSKSVGKRAVVTADYTFQSGVETIREAVKVNTKELKAVDSIRFEAYQRTDVNPDAGFAVSAEKSWFKKRLTVGGGYAQIDKAYGGLNGDRYNKGKRLFATGTFVVSPEFTINTFATQAVRNPYAIANHTRFDLIFSYNLLKTLQRARLF